MVKHHAPPIRQLSLVQQFISFFPSFLPCEIEQSRAEQQQHALSLRLICFISISPFLSFLLLSHPPLVLDDHNTYVIYLFVLKGLNVI